jgi:hypothetical protein
MKKKEIKEIVIDTNNDKLKATPKIKSRFNTINRILKFFEKVIILNIYQYFLFMICSFNINRFNLQYFFLLILKKKFLQVQKV